jgi:hypothetical protein
MWTVDAQGGKQGVHGAFWTCAARWGGASGTLPKLDVAGSSPVARSTEDIDQQAFTEIGDLIRSPIFLFPTAPERSPDENLGTVAHLAGDDG